jgi:hypothetical protein
MDKQDGQDTDLSILPIPVNTDASPFARQARRPPPIRNENVAGDI